MTQVLKLTTHSHTGHLSVLISNSFIWQGFSLDVLPEESCFPQLFTLSSFSSVKYHLLREGFPKKYPKDPLNHSLTSSCFTFFVTLMILSTFLVYLEVIQQSDWACRLHNQTGCIQTAVLPFTSYVTLDKLLNLSVP